VIADNPEEKIELKAFCSEILNDHKALTKKELTFTDLPEIAVVSLKEIAKLFSY
jgi:hypothetical protein